MEGKTPLDEQFTIDDLETLKVIADPLRLQILKTLRHPKTVKEIAAAVGHSPTKLYYHVNQLEKHKLIQVVATNIVSGIIEKQYHVTARRYHVDDSLLSDEAFTERNLENLVLAILEDTKAEIRQAIKQGLIDISHPTQKTAHFTRGGFHLSTAQAAEFGAELESLCRKYETLSNEMSDMPEAKSYGYTVAFYPAYRPQNDAGVEDHTMTHDQGQEKL